MMGRLLALLALALGVTLDRGGRPPLYAITDAGGRFRLPGVEQGPHTLAVWHERLGQVTAPVSIDAGGEVRVEIAYPALRVSGGQR